MKHILLTFLLTLSACSDSGPGTNQSELRFPEPNTPINDVPIYDSSCEDIVGHMYDLNMYPVENSNDCGVVNLSVRRLMLEEEEAYYSILGRKISYKLYDYYAQEGQCFVSLFNELSDHTYQYLELILSEDDWSGSGFLVLYNEPTCVSSLEIQVLPTAVQLL